MSKTDLPSLPETPAGASGVRAPAFPLAPGSAARCPKCNGVGYYVRTRYFDGEAADVWECQSPQCTSFGLLWHVSRPYSDAENMARATQMTDAELVTHLRTMARIFDGQLAKWVLGVAAERIERHSSQNILDLQRAASAAPAQPTQK